VTELCFAAPRDESAPQNRVVRRSRALAFTLLLAVAAAGWLFFTRSGVLVQERLGLLDPARIVIVRTPGGLLQVSTVEKAEEFGWKTSWDCPLVDCSRVVPPTVSHVRVKASYVYVVPLAAEWKLEPKGDHYELRVPPLQLQEPVGFSTQDLQIRTQTTWASPSVTGNREQLLRHLGPELAARGRQVEYLQAQRDAAAKTVEEFARKWMREQGVRADKPVKVQFGAPAL
jgi:hypothetical protein